LQTFINVISIINKTEILCKILGRKRKHVEARHSLKPSITGKNSTKIDRKANEVEEKEGNRYS